MALPIFAEARPFYQAAMQRVEDARFLLLAGRNTAAVYLAGYAVECMLKALLLSRIAKANARQETVASFRGARAHDYAWLRAEYLNRGGPAIPASAEKDFARVNLDDASTIQARHVEEA